MLLIGIDEYLSPRYDRLNNGKKDIERFKNILETRYGFSVFSEPIYDADATRATIIDALNSLCFGLRPEDNVVIYYAGHGEQHLTSRVGYWVPHDTKGPSDWISNSDVINYIEGMAAKHILLISDSCFSGTFLTKTRGPGKILDHDELESLKSRWVFVSGGEETVSDGAMGKGSPFNQSICNLLQSNEAPTLSVSQLFDFVIRNVESKRKQTPQAAPIRCDGNEGGEMIFRLLPSLTNNRTEIIKLNFPLPEFQYEYYIPRAVTYYDQQQPDKSYFFETAIGTSLLIDTINSHKRIVLLGSAGSGKSIELLHLAAQLADTKSAYIPIYKRFNTYTGQDIKDYLPEGWEKANETTTVILLDGLDEIQPQFLFIAIRKIIGFSEQHQSRTIVISCRTNFYELPTKDFSGTLDHFSVFSLNDISLKQIKDFATENLQVDGDQFLQEVYNASFLDLIQKPYFLNLIANRFVANGTLTSDRAQLFEQAIENYFIRDKEHFKTTITLNKSKVFANLEKVAFVMELMGKNFLSENELNKVVPETGGIEIWKYLPGFKKNERTNQWMFEHNNIQEYLAARVLASRSFDKLIEIISVSSAEQLKIRPTWLNTISFFVSINQDNKTEKLLQWIIENDIEVLIRFEPDRLSKETRNLVFKRIFQFYEDRKIWLTSNKFSGADLARFGHSEEIIDYLLEKLNDPDAHRIVKLNVVRVLDDYSLTEFKQKSDSVKSSILGALERSSFSESDTYSMIAALARLKIVDSETVEALVKKYRNRQNQYIRAGLYMLIYESSLSDRYLDVLLDGLDLRRIENPINDRDEVSLGDENFHLTRALKSIKSPSAIKQLFDFLSHENGYHIYHDELKEIIECLTENSIESFKSDNKVYDAVRGFFVSLEFDYNKNLKQTILKFFEATNTKWMVFVFIWSSDTIPEYHKHELFLSLLDTGIIEKFVREFQIGRFTADEIVKMHEFLFWSSNQRTDFLDFLSLLENAVHGMGMELKRPQVKDWNAINQKRTQESFDLLFDSQLMLQEIRGLFALFGKSEIGRNDLFELHSKSSSSVREYAFSTRDLLRDLVHDFGYVTLDLIEAIVQDHDRFAEYQIEAVYQYLHGSQADLLEVNFQHEQQIKEWCLNQTLDEKFLWFFLHRFKLPLGEERLLAFTLYYDYGSEGNPEEPGTIEKIESFISKLSLKRRVKANLEQNIPNSMVWLSNASYALRQNMRDTYPLIIKYLQESKKEEYKFNTLLTFWFKKSEDSERLKSFVLAVNSETLRQEAILLLIKEDRETIFLRDYLLKRMNDENELLEFRFNAANDLMRLNNVEGLQFVSSYILENHSSQLEFRRLLANVSVLKQTEAVPWLTELLALSKKEGYNSDPFNNLEHLVIDALFNIGIQSDVALEFVSSAINKFINDHQQQYPDVNFLHFTIIRMQEQFNTQKSTGLSIVNALQEWERAN